MKKIKMLCVCAKGFNRSKYLAKYLRRKGYSTHYGGIDEDDKVTKEHPIKQKIMHPIRQKEVDWADFVIIIRRRLKRLFDKKFKHKGKKIIVLDVTDSRRIACEKFPHLAKLPYEEFQKKWTRPLLRKAIKSYLPLKK